MATKQMFARCEEHIKRIGLRNIRTNKLVTIDLDFFGIESLISEDELMKLSETEQRRHKRQDVAMGVVYGNA
jgi:hypothetical protein